MLSPNARMVPTRSVGDDNVTATANEQLAVRWTASVAVQVTVVEPSAKVEPLGGVQETVTGAVPPVTAGDP